MANTKISALTAIVSVADEDLLAVVDDPSGTPATTKATVTQLKTQILANRAIGTDIQAYDAGLADIAGLAVTDSNVIVGDGANWVAESGATARTSLGLAIGTDVQAYDAGLADIAGLAVTDGNVIVGDGVNWVAESGATARTSLGLAIGTDVLAFDQELQDFADSAITVTSDALAGTSSITTASSGTVVFSDGDSSHTTSLAAHATTTASVAYTLPAADGTSGQALTTNALGVLSWSTITSGATDIDGLSDAELDGSNNLYFGAEVPGTASGALDNIAISGNGEALDAITSGDYNIGIGSTGPGGALTSGLDNIAIGRRALNSNTTTSYNVSIGSEANRLTAGHTKSVAIGFGASRSGAGQNSTYVGAESGYAGSSTGIDDVTALGYQTLYNATGDRNTAVGASAGNLITTGAQNTLIGEDCDVDANTRSDATVVGNGLTAGAEDGAIAIGSSTVAGNVLRVESGVATVGGSPIDPYFLYAPEGASDADDDEFLTDSTGDYTAVTPSGTITWTHARHGLVSMPTASISGSDMCGFMKAGTLATGEWLETAVSSMTLSGNDSIKGGICLSDGTTTGSNMVCCNVLNDGDSIDSWTVGGTFTAYSTLANVSFSHSFGTHLFLRLKNNGSDEYEFGYSLDGATWIAAGTSAVTEAHTFTHIGFSNTNAGGSYNVGAHLRYEYLRIRS